MPFQTPTLPETRALSRDYLAAFLAGGADLPPNSRARVLSDDMAGLAFGAYQFIARLASEFLPDQALDEFLDRWANIYLGGRLPATFAVGSAAFTGIEGTVLPVSTQVAGAGGAVFETTEVATIGSDATPVAIRAVSAGVGGNLSPGSPLALVVAVQGVDSDVTVVALTGGIDAEGTESLRDRVLERIRKPPMGGDADDFVAWARAVPGVTRAWCSPLEMGVGTVTTRFMMDGLRADRGGFPLPEDVEAVRAYVDLNRPVAVRDSFVVAPRPEPIDFTVANLVPNTSSTRAAIRSSVAAMLRERAAPARAKGGIRIEAQVIYSAWVSAAILEAEGVSHFDLVMDDHPMPYNGAIAVLGTVTFA